MPARFNRRTFLRATASAFPLLASADFARLSAGALGSELRADLVIIGGGLGGCAAALAACRAGLNVILTEETDWVGGQVTAQAVPPDEHPWIEQFGCTRTYREYRDRVRAFYRDRYPLTPEARAQAHFNPGNGWVSRICHEPRVSLAVLHEMLAPHLSSGRLQLLTEHCPVAAETDHDQVRAVVVQDLRQNTRRTLTAPWFIDATELGDLLPLTGAEFVTGAESRHETGEPHAPDHALPDNQQAITCCFAIDHLPGEDHIIARPAEYAFWREYVPAMTPPWPGPLLSWRTTHPITLEPREIAFDPTLRVATPNLWAYRRILDAAQFAPGAFRSGISLINWPQNDYWLGPLVGSRNAEQLSALKGQEPTGPSLTRPPGTLSHPMGEGRGDGQSTNGRAMTASAHLARAKQLSLSLLYWMQTEAPRPDGGTGWKGLRLRPDIVGTTDGLAKYPYIREARRIRAEFTVLEQHVSTEARLAATGRPRDEVQAEPFADSVGVGAYRIDLHPSTGGRNYVDLSSLPFQIPLGALIPRRIENLLAAAKNVGTTHITNGCYRLHPVEWNIGEAAGALAAFCKAQKTLLRQVRRDPKLLADFQRRLRDQGVELDWPRLRPL